ncbi:tRNA(Ile)-lysidine synthase/bifunctional protein TilS/HprT [Psychrobacillus sp. OK028]|uniref:tRNA lysidine(34) synthetase TilS n=1 Tax=Psychrobacillus sp. OK028 TaxID=1884359 RepID=UPI00088FA11E|nr:tRNA lysidine(34) synthetase TilS [Psychrobacillus sp. OK028]SDO27497.1 tRNA(Ile)-lysidine synthase/bifunctional protein TilS/HprT [Psychrobacillus sp. OK028]
MHPFIIKVKKYIEQHQLIQSGDRLLLACSGGADSVAAVLTFYELKEFYNIKLGIVHTDHQLRGDESAGDMDFVEQLANRLDIPFYGATLEVPARVEAEGGNVQVICREERYAYFDTIMQQEHFDKLVLGHHADDQIETIVMSLVRGSLASSLTGIPITRPFSNGSIIRPFLCVTKEEILDFVQVQEQSYRHDPSNDKHTYTRNRLRHTVVPLLRQENVHVADSIRTFVEKQQQDDIFLQKLAKEKFDQLVTIQSKSSFFMDTIEFSEIPVALQRRVILILLKYLYDSSNTLLNNRLIESILAACNEQDGNTMIHLPKGFFLKRHYSQVQFSSYPIHSLPIQTQLIDEDCWSTVGAGYSIYLTRNLNEQVPSDEKWFIQLENDSLPLSVRPRMEGDRIHLKGMSTPKKVSRLFIDEKIPTEERVVWPILVSAKNDIMAVIGLRYGQQFEKNRNTQNFVLYVRVIKP